MIGRTWALALVLLALLAVTGCGEVEEKMRADETVQSALAAQSALASSHMEASLVATVQGARNGAPLSVSLNGGKASIDADWAHRKVKADAQVGVTYNEMQFGASADLYAIDNQYYRQAAYAVVTENWTKEALPADFWPVLTDARVMNGLLRYVESELVGDEEVGGVDCSVIRLTPDFAAIRQALGEKYPPVAEVPDPAGLFDHQSLVVWVARDTSFITRIEVSARIQATAEALGPALAQELGQAPDGDPLDVNFTLTVEASGFNEPVTVELPAEAQGAS